MSESNITEILDPVTRLTRDLKTAARTLSHNEARFLVDSYYTIQNYRKTAANQMRALSESKEPCEVLNWLFGNMETLESQIKRALDAWTDASEIGQWCKSITGIGPVIAAGLVAHIKMDKAPTAGHIWSFAGLDPTKKWEKGQKRPWNADLKVLCWKIGESFVKVSSNDKDKYGKVWLERKALEIAKNDMGDFAEQAKLILETKKIDKSTDAYKWYSGMFPAGTMAGILGIDDQAKRAKYLDTQAALVADGTMNGVRMLPPAHIHARAKRYAVKLFLAHFHHVAYELHYKAQPPKPYIIEHGGHTHFIAPPNWPMNKAA